MQKRTREIIALLILIVLVIGTICGVTWYILVGHNWNEAASNIDDHFGSMDGYTVLLYDGVIPSPEQLQSASLAYAKAHNAADRDDDGDGEEKTAEEPLTLEAAAASYREKGAQVIIIRPDDWRFYEDPVITPRNGKRYAIFTAASPNPRLAARQVIKGLRSSDVDFTICLVDDIDALRDGFSSVNIAICTDIDDAGKGGRYIGRTYTVGSPYLGEVGAILIAPSGFLSTKTLVEL